MMSHAWHPLPRRAKDRKSCARPGQRGHAPPQGGPRESASVSEASLARSRAESAVNDGGLVLSLGARETILSVELLELFDVHPAMACHHPLQQIDPVAILEVALLIAQDETAAPVIDTVGYGAGGGKDLGAAVGDHLQHESRSLGDAHKDVAHLLRRQASFDEDI